jgi:hypothetical protein
VEMELIQENGAHNPAVGYKPHAALVWRPINLRAVERLPPFSIWSDERPPRVGPGGLRAVLRRSGGQADWQPQWSALGPISISTPRPPASSRRPWLRLLTKSTN